MKKKLRKVLLVVLAVVFAVSINMLTRQYFDNTGADAAYDTAMEIAMASEGEAAASMAETQPQTVKQAWVPEAVEDDPQMEELEKMDLAALQEVNPDVVGWIRIPDTKVDYPLLQGQDNDFYLNKTWDKKKNSVGSIFLEHRNSNDFTDYNTIVYGHNMNDGSMFAALRDYTDHHYWKKHPYIYVRTGAGVFRYEVFSSYKAKLDSPAYGLSFQQSETKAKFLTESLKQSRYDTEIIPAPNDRILTLSTCSGMGYTSRWLVQARLKMVQVPKS